MRLAQNGARNNIPKILVLLTSGSRSYTDLEDPVVVAQELRDQGIKLIVVGIPFHEDSKLVDFGGTAEKVFIADNATHLNSAHFIENVTKIACELGMYIELYLLKTYIMSILLYFLFVFRSAGKEGREIGFHQTPERQN